GLWSADLSGVAWQRGEHTLRTVVATKEAVPHQHSQELVLRYQPPAPRIKFVPGDDQMIVDKPAFTLKAEVFRGDIDEPVLVRFRHNGQEAAWRPAVEFPLQDNQLFTLKPGENALQIVAMNRDALAGYEDLETTEQTLLVTYNPPKEEPRPTIALEA